MLTQTFTPALIGLMLAGCAAVQAPKAEEDHSAHHPVGSTAPPATSATPVAAVDRPAPSPESVERQLKAMQDMHQCMQAAKTPAQRGALMDEHMKLMQSGMAMMGQLRGDAGGRRPMAGMGAGAMGMAPPTSRASPAAPPANAGTQGVMGMHDRMESRVTMMEQMMQMMVDREAAIPPK